MAQGGRRRARSARPTKGEGAKKIFFSALLRCAFRGLTRSASAMDFDSKIFPLRPAWVEIELARLRSNLRLIRRELPRDVKLLAVVKDEAYGHGALDVARIAL